MYKFSDTYEPVKAIMTKIGETVYFKNCKKIEHPVKKFMIETHLHKLYGFAIYLVLQVNNKVFEPMYYRTEAEEELQKFLINYF